MSASIIKTARLRLRPYAPDDAADIARLIGDWDVVRWLSVPPYPYTVADAEYYLRDVVDDWHWAVEIDGAFAGGVSVKPDIGYWLAKPYWGQGYMSEAAQAVVDHYFSQIHEPLVSGYHLGNAGSRAILEKLGFTNTHIETSHAVALDKEVDIQRVVLTAKEWAARNA